MDASCSSQLHTAPPQLHSAEETEMLDRFLRPAERRHRHLVDTLLQYARDQISANRSAIEQNLQARNLAGKKIDLLWPGAGYYSVACGGQWQALYELGRGGGAGLRNRGASAAEAPSSASAQPLLSVDRVCGASGGACSAILAAPNRDARFLLNAYLAYADHQSALGYLKEALRVTPLWRALYLESYNRQADHGEKEMLSAGAEQGANASLLLQKRFIAVNANALTSRENVVFHNFADASELANAGVASGELTLYGMAKGVAISDTEKVNPAVPKTTSWLGFGKPQRYMDGGMATYMNVREDVPSCSCGGGHYQNDGICDRAVVEKDHDHKRRTPFLAYATFFGRDIEDVATGAHDEARGLPRSMALQCTPESVEWLFKRGVDDTVQWLLSPHLQTEKMLVYRADLWPEKVIATREAMDAQILKEMAEITSADKMKNNENMIEWGPRTNWTCSFGVGQTKFIDLSTSSSERAPTS